MLLFLTGCSAAETTAPDSMSAQVETVAPVEVVEDGMTPVTADMLQPGDYEVTVDSSSSMFSITSCTLHVTDSGMTADMTMSGTGYLYLYMGTVEEAQSADEKDRIPFTENADGTHTFTVPVTALDAGIECAAFSKKKEIWYGRTLLFRADSLPSDARADLVTAESLGLTDGVYAVDVTLSGGSGKATIHSPAELTVNDGQAVVHLVWGSDKYDYMTVDGVRYDPVTLEGGSAFDIPVMGFDYEMPVSADTIAMSTPHEIAYTLRFDSASVKDAT